MHIIRVEASLLDGSYTLVPDDGEIQQEEAANVIVVEDLSDSLTLSRKASTGHDLILKFLQLLMFVFYECAFTL